MVWESNTRKENKRRRIMGNSPYDKKAQKKRCAHMAKIQQYLESKEFHLISNEEWKRIKECCRFKSGR